MPEKGKVAMLVKLYRIVLNTLILFDTCGGASIFPGANSPIVPACLGSISAIFHVAPLPAPVLAAVYEKPSTGLVCALLYSPDLSGKEEICCGTHDRVKHEVKSFISPVLMQDEP